MSERNSSMMIDGDDLSQFEKEIERAQEEEAQRQSVKRDFHDADDGIPSELQGKIPQVSAAPDSDSSSLKTTKRDFDSGELQNQKLESRKATSGEVAEIADGDCINKSTSASDFRGQENNAKRQRGESSKMSQNVVVSEGITSAAPELSVEYIEALNRLRGKKRSYRDDYTSDFAMNQSQEKNGRSEIENSKRGEVDMPNAGKKYLRTAAGKIWEDKTLMDWPENDFRIWVGQLGPETKDETLRACFSRYASFNMARVVMNKRTSECKGYGFVSFSDPMEMVRAMRENQGKYCGSRRMMIKRSENEKRDLKLVRKQNQKHTKLLKKLGVE